MVLSGFCFFGRNQRARGTSKVPRIRGEPAPREGQPQAYNHSGGAPRQRASCETTSRFCSPSTSLCPPLPLEFALRTSGADDEVGWTWGPTSTGTVVQYCEVCVEGKLAESRQLDRDVLQSMRPRSKIHRLTKNASMLGSYHSMCGGVGWSQ